MFLFNVNVLRAIAYIVLFFMVTTIILPFVLAEEAYAGTDNTFNAGITLLAGYINGSAGRLAALVALGYGVIRMATDGWSVGNVGVPVAVGLAAGVGGPIVQAAVTALI